LTLHFAADTVRVSPRAFVAGCSFQIFYKGSRFPLLERNWEAGANPALPRNCKRVFLATGHCANGKAAALVAICGSQLASQETGAKLSSNPLSREEES